MKKLKSLFRLLPAFALAFISGLGAVLNYDKAPKATYALDNLPIFEKQQNTSISYVGTNNVLNPSANYVNSILFNGTFRVYRDLNTNNLNVTYLFTLPNTTVTYSNIGVFNFTAPAGSTYALNLNNLQLGTETDNYFRVAFTYIGTFNRSFTVAGVTTLVSYDLQFGITLTYNGYTTTQIYYIDNIILNSYYNNTIYSGSLFPSDLFNINNFDITLIEGNFDPDSVTAYEQGYIDGYDSGYNSAYSDGYSSGYSAGYDIGYQAGVESQTQAIADSYTSGYNVGYNEAFSANATVSTIFSGILQIGMLPVNFFLAIFNFEILGVNLSAFVSAILTVCLTVIVIRTIKGGGSSD